MNMRLRLKLVVGISVALVAIPAIAQPRRPTEPQEILERLPRAPRTRELEQQFYHLQQLDLPSALNLAREYFALGRSQFDPRYFGYAEAAIRPWLEQQPIPPKVLVIRAMLRQHRHDFDGALADLDNALEHEPRNAQAWMTKAILHQTRGEFDAGTKACLHLLPLTDELTQISCLASIKSLSGEAEHSYTLLQQVLNRNPDSPAELRSWAETVLGDIKNRLGDTAAAEKHFKHALELSPGDAFLLGEYADLLVRLKRSSEAETLLRDYIQSDALLLRYALAQQANNATSLSETQSQLAERFQRSSQRNERIHQREEAIFNLDILGNIEQAHALALENWQKQHEPIDILLLLRTSTIKKDRTAATLALQFINQNHIEDHRIQAWREQPEVKKFLAS